MIPSSIHRRLRPRAATTARERRPSSNLRLLAVLIALAAGSAAATVSSAAQEVQRSGSATARGNSAQTGAPACIVRSLPAFTAQGEQATAATVADVIEVECNPSLYGTNSKITVTASQLFSRCDGNLTWYVPNPFQVLRGKLGVPLTLDADGNATVALLAGPGCAAGESLISAHMEEAPFETFTTSFTVLPPMTTTPGVFALPSSQVEDDVSSSAATIVQVEFAAGSEKEVRIGSEELFHRCRVAPHLRWVLMNGAVQGGGGEEEGTGEVEKVQLDNDGNAFVIAIADGSCAEGGSLIEADLESKPFTTFATTFTILPPQPTAEPSFSIEKLQRIAGAASGYTKSPLSGALGQTVEYEVLVKNTGGVPESFGDFNDAHCDPGTIAGGPGSSALAPGASTTYTCAHVLNSVGPYTNEATVTGTTAGGVPLTQTSNQVLVEVPRAPAFTIEKEQQIAGSGAAFTKARLTGAIGQTVDYQIRVSNTGNEPLTFSGFSDLQCDPATIAGGPGEAPLAPGAAATYTCRHVLVSVGTYVNEASVTGTPPDGPAIAHVSNQVETVVPASPSSPPQVLSGVSPAEKISVKPFCESALPAMHLPSGPRNGTVTLHISAADVKQVTFYLDGRKLKTLKHSQARGGKFTLTLDVRKLSYGGHTLSVKAVPMNALCASAASSGVIVRQRPVIAVKFTG